MCTQFGQSLDIQECQCKTLVVTLAMSSLLTCHVIASYMPLLFLWKFFKCMILGWVHVVPALRTCTYATSIPLPFQNDGERQGDGLTTTTLSIVYRLSHKVDFTFRFTVLFDEFFMFSNFCTTKLLLH